MSTTATKKKKRGNQGDFHGQRLAFLEDRLPAYRSASQDGITRSWFTEEFFPEYWKTFNWRLPLNEDPVEQATTSNDEELSPEELMNKAEVMKAVHVKLRTWYNNRRGALKLNTNKDPWRPWLAQLRKPLDGPPGCPHDYQFYMRHPDYKAKVATTFDKEWAALSPDKRVEDKIDFRCQVSRSLLALEKDEIKAKLEEECQAAHKEAMERYKRGISVEDVKDPQDQADAIEVFSTVVQPLLDGLRAHTGMFIQLTAALPSADSSAAKCILYVSPYITPLKELNPVKPLISVYEAIPEVGYGGAWCPPPSALNGSGPIEMVNAMKPATAAPHTQTTDAPIGQAGSTQRNASSSTNARSSPTLDPPSPSPPVHSAAATPSKTPKAAPHVANQPPGIEESPKERAQRLLEKAMASVREALTEAGLSADLEPSTLLLKEVAKLAPNARKDRIRELSVMKRFEFERQATMAANRELLAQLGLENPTSVFKGRKKKDQEQGESEGHDEDDYQPTASRTAPEAEPRRSTRGRKAPAAVGGPMEATEPSRKALGGAIFGGDDEALAGGGRTEGESLAGGVTQGAIRDDGITTDPPKWFPNAVKEFTKVDHEAFGEKWFDLVERWRKWEEANDHIPNTNKRLRQGGNGPWDGVNVMGSNGLISVITALWWLRQKTSDSNPTIERWHEAVEDVLWVLKNGCRPEMVIRRADDTQGDETDGGSGDGVDENSGEDGEEAEERPRKRARVG
ncbi:hypothetical protein EYR38_002026 [Pleurotus pulmonarius]|nr:hypothetical protein EYR38_002026 [Pleurotus pulmonarius]